MGVQFNPGLLQKLPGATGGKGANGADQQQDNNSNVTAPQFAGIGQQNPQQAQQTPPATDPSQGQRLNVLG
jgi:hypothetical protein